MSDSTNHPLTAATGDDNADVALMLRFQAHRDFEAFQTLFDRHKSRLLGYLHSLTGDSAAAEDISQYCWLRLVELAKADRYRAQQGATFRTFLYTLGRNRFLDEFVRKHEVAKRASTDVQSVLDQQQYDAPETSNDPQQLLVSKEQSEQLAAALAQLPFEQREVIALWTAGTTTKEMMLLTEAPRDTVLSRKKYGISKLRAALSADWQSAQRADNEAKTSP